MLMLLISVKLLSKPAYNKSAAATTWKKIAPFFVVPNEFKEQYGNYRLPLRFYDGRPVKNKKDWERRREEIHNRWIEMMGGWPPLIKNQEMEILDSTHREDFTQYSVRFNWRPDQKKEGYLLVPDGGGIRPAVITVFYFPEPAIGLPTLANRKYDNIDFAYQLTKRGFITLSIGVGEGNRVLYYPDLEHAKIQPISMQAYVAGNAWFALSKVQGVDSARIGIVGISYGGKWAMFASCLFDKFACAAWSAPGIVFDETRGNVNYWAPWYLGYYPPPWRPGGMLSEQNPATGLYPKLVAEGYDLHELHALMAPRPFLVSGGAEDTPKQWIPLNHSIAVNKLLGYDNRVAMTNRPKHASNPEANEQMYLFFDYFLKYNGISSKSTKSRSKR